MSLTPDLVGTTSEPVQVSWTEDDVVLYALAVGAGQDDPTVDLCSTTENTSGSSLRVLTSYANIITQQARVHLGEVDHSRLVHAEQSFSVSHPLPVSGSATVRATVTEVLDKGGAALVRTESTAVDRSRPQSTGEHLATSVQTVFIPGAGGFGGPRGESSPSPVPDGEPDETVVVHTRPEQALLYRLTGDRNPLHSDPTVAERGGYSQPIMHGMCTYGFTGRVLLDRVCDDDPARLKGMSARFSSPVWPGDDLTVQIWHPQDSTGRAHFRTVRDDTAVLDRGVVHV